MNSSRRAPGLYVHIPFCRSRCSYCTFASGSYREELADRYLESLARELAFRNCFAGNPPSTVFIGGGTPSSLLPRQITALLEILPRPDGGGEYSCELNPDSADTEKLRLLREGGVTRCSFGVQTFSSGGLSLLERRHDAAMAKAKVREAVGMGFSSVSIDLITAWPGQTLEDLREDLRIALDLGGDHLSCYNLMIEERSRIGALMNEAGLEEKKDEEYRAFWDCTEEMLANAGFAHYETSNFAKPGRECRHNLHTWQGWDYLGIGAAAHSHFAGRRFANTPEVDEYIRRIRSGGNAECFSEVLEGKEKARETAVFWLRLFSGIDRRGYAETTGFTFEEVYGEGMDELVEKGWLACSEDGKRIFVPRDLHPLLDSILVELL